MSAATLPPLAVTGQHHEDTDDQAQDQDHSPKGQHGGAHVLDRLVRDDLGDADAVLVAHLDHAGRRVGALASCHTGRAVR